MSARINADEDCVRGREEDKNEQRVSSRGRLGNEGNETVQKFLARKWLSIENRGSASGYIAILGLDVEWLDYIVIVSWKRYPGETEHFRGWRDRERKASVT